MKQQMKLIEGLMKRWDDLSEKSMDFLLSSMKEKDPVKKALIDRQWRENWLLESKVIKTLVPLLENLNKKDEKPNEVLSLEHYTNFTLPSEKLTKEDILAGF